MTDGARDALKAAAMVLGALVLVAVMIALLEARAGRL